MKTGATAVESAIAMGLARKDDIRNVVVCYAEGIGDIDQAGPNSHLVLYMLQKNVAAAARQLH